MADDTGAERATPAAVEPALAGGVEARGRSAFGRWLTLTLCPLWIAFGLTGHEPWKPDEGYTFGVVQGIEQTGDVVVPRLVGEPFMEKPPLFFATAALFERAFGRWLPLPDAARLATGLFLALTLACLGLAERELRGREATLHSPLLLIGALGLFEVSHRLQTDIALIAGLTLALYALGLGRRRPAAGGALLGAGVTIAFLSKGLLGPGLIGLTCLALRLLPEWRARLPLPFYGWCAAVALPLCAAWPLALYERSPALFDDWLWLNNFARFAGATRIGPPHPPWFWTLTVPWFTFPLLPLAALALRAAPLKDWRALPVIFVAITLAVLAVAGEARAVYALPLLPPLALLAAEGVERVGGRAAVLLNAACGWLFGATALALWAGWAALLAGWPAPVAQLLLERAPGYAERARALALVAALGITAIWAANQRTIARERYSPAWSWAAGMTLVWGLAATLWLPLLDYAKSYRGVFEDLAAHVSPAGCVERVNVGESERALLQYYAGLSTLPPQAPGAADCGSLLVEYRFARRPRLPTGRWIQAWQGRRPGDDHEFFRLYLRG